jgi:hypothetical protein
MLSLAQFDLPVLAVALAIGLATGRWMFRRPKSLQEKTKAP